MAQCARIQKLFNILFKVVAVNVVEIVSLVGLLKFGVVSELVGAVCGRQLLSGRPKLKPTR